MEEAHAGMCITDDEFDAMTEDLLEAYDGLGIPYSVRLDGSAVGDGLANALLSMRSSVVEDCAR